LGGPGPGDPVDLDAVFPPRTLALPGGRELVVRALRSRDSPALEGLYRGLAAEDRYRRFFSGAMPPRPWVERIASVADQGGFGLIVLERRPCDGTEGTAVAEASYSLLPNGDGDLAITVAGERRGWLGAYLLDALIAVAASQGVPNLEAEVLTANRSMLALARSRGYATMGHADWTTVRLVIGVQGPEPRWPGPHDRPRVLVEAPGGRWGSEEAARRAGLQVLVCPGPPSRRRACPALEGRPCPLAAEADAVVVSPPPSGGAWRDLPAAHRSVHPGVPVCVEVRPGEGPGPEGWATVTAGDTEAVVGFLSRLARSGPEDPGPDPGPPDRPQPAGPIGPEDPVPPDRPRPPAPPPR
jgi:L-amino acid N-acyltransferase YncA